MLGVVRLPGSMFDDAACAKAIRTAGLPFDTFDEQGLVDRTTELLLDGKVAGWFQGRHGIRARASKPHAARRSASNRHARHHLRIKFREKFRPFAPSILEEHVSDWFEINEPAPYMEKVFPIRPEQRARIPAVTHVDGSGRLQTVSKRTNPLYHALISRFHERTGVPILLNTSLNENEPIVRTPAEAIDCFLRTDMDALVLGNHLVDRHHPDFPSRATIP